VQQVDLEMPYGYGYAASSSSSDDDYYYGSRAASASSTSSSYESETMYYAVAVGRRTGIFTDYWGEVEGLTKGFPGVQFKKFVDRADAEHYLFLRGVYESLEDDTDWYYAVAIGRFPGIYTFSGDAVDQTSGFSGSRMKKFERFWQAEAYLASYGLMLQDRCAFQDEDGDRHWHAKVRPAHVIDPRDPDTLVAFCNGSALRNGSRSACAAFACVFPHNRSWDEVGLVRHPPPTNNRAEYEAALTAMERANTEDPSQKQPLFVYTNNELLIKTMQNWVHTWRANGWRKSNGKPVKNQDLILDLLDAQGGRSVYWRHVRANAEVTSWVTHWKDVADQRAKSFSRSVDSF
jgi:ribonuclease HI